MDEVDVEPVDLTGELVKAIKLGLAATPVIRVRPVLADIFNPFQRSALAPVPDQFRIRPAGATQSLFEVGEHIVADIDTKGPYRSSHRSLPILRAIYSSYFLGRTT
jgi:hypothetical protein